MTAFFGAWRVSILEAPIGVFILANRALIPCDRKPQFQLVVEFLHPHLVLDRSGGVRPAVLKLICV